MVLCFRIKSEQAETIDISQTTSVQKDTLPDKSEVYRANTEFLDAFVLKKIANPKYLKETTSWEVYNGTDNTGLGSEIARIVANSGFLVSGVRQAQQMYNTSFISVRPGLAITDSVKEFSHYFDLPLKQETDFHNRADVVFVVGNDFWKKYFQR